MDVFKWFRGRSEASRLEQGDVKALIHGYGYGAYCEACRRELDAGMLEMTSYRGSTSERWGVVALLLADRIEALKDEADKRSRLDTAIRMIDFQGH